MENKTEFKINGDYIELLALLKAIGIAQTGGHAKMIVDSEEVNRNGTIELRRRAKCVKGDIIIVGEQSIALT
jgi:ribosome-associated protein